MTTGIIIIFRHGSDFAGVFYTCASNTTSALNPLPRLRTLARRVQIGCHGPRHSRVVCRRFRRQLHNGSLRVLLWAISRMVTKDSSTNRGTTRKWCMYALIKRTHHHIWVIFAMWHTNVLNHGFLIGFRFVSILLESILFFSSEQTVLLEVFIQLPDHNTGSCAINRLTSD